MKLKCYECKHIFAATEGWPVGKYYICPKCGSQDIVRPEQ